MEQPTTLVVEDDKHMQFVLQECLKRIGHKTLIAGDGQQALYLFEKNLPDLVILDLNLPRIHGLEVLKHMKAIWPEALIVILTGYGTISTAVESMKEGAYDFISKPFEVDTLLSIVDEAMEKRKVIRENRSAQDVSYQLDICPLPRKLDDLITSVAQSDYTVLLEGESGTGKTLIAEEIHRRSPRNQGPFVRVDCASLPANLIESELFGYEKGAFTGAVNRKIGKVERAHGGTLFLDEISTLDYHAQGALLSLIQNREFERIGGTKAHVIDIRVIAASNQNLKQMVRDKTFRHDLYYRLNVFTIVMPPLRQRKEDIIPLAYFFLRKYSQRTDLSFSTEAAMKLREYEWPGNIRELENAIKHALILSKGSAVIESRHLPLELNQGYWGIRDKNMSLKDILNATEKSAIEQSLLENNLDIGACAKSLHISRRSLLYRMKKLNITLAPLED